MRGLVVEMLNAINYNVKEEMLNMMNPRIQGTHTLGGCLYRSTESGVLRCFGRKHK